LMSVKRYPQLPMAGRICRLIYIGVSLFLLTATACGVYSAMKTPFVRGRLFGL
jgi:uncharacterized metal-binding protein